MQTLTWTNIDKSSWPRGIWDAEPDKVQWQDEATGLPCIAKRVPYSGHWCGYVGVPPTHPFYEKDYDEVDDVECHGGLTFASSCQEGEPGETICYVPAPGEPDDIWWLGFDCAHWSDYQPAMEQFGRLPAGTYRTLAYVKDQCASLAAQLKALTP